MKKRLTGKKAGIVILAVLFVLSIADVILRSVIMKESMLNVANAGEPFITALFSLMLIIFAVKGKARLFYICTGAFLAYFVLNQLFGLPGMAATLIHEITTANIFGIIAAIAHVCSMICIVAIGGLLVEYMNDGSIYNKAFNILCSITALLLLFLFLHSQNNVFTFGYTYAIFVSLNALTRLTMVFLFSFFAYDSAKAQLKKTKL